MNEFDFWKFFHDGGLEEISGHVPGTVVVTISIRYIRSRFPGPGTGFVITLANCNQFEYTPYDEPPCTDFQEILRLDPEILSLAGNSDTVVINCTMGTLTLSYSSASIALDTGGTVLPAQLAQASRDYWEEFESRGEKNA